MSSLIALLLESGNLFLEPADFIFVIDNLLARLKEEAIRDLAVPEQLHHPTPQNEGLIFDSLILGGYRPPNGHLLDFKIHDIASLVDLLTNLTEKVAGTIFQLVNEIHAILPILILPSSSIRLHEQDHRHCP